MPRQPPFRSAPAVGGADFCSEDGARILAARIAGAWADCGVTVRPVVERDPVQTSLFTGD